jgi:DNA segregation ATPase FtsK/SpoIIIE-like protein
MARVSRKARATTRIRLNLEIAGIAAFGLALLLGFSLAAPARTGAVGFWLAHALAAGFGGAAWLVPILVAIVGGIVFLEINVPRLIATFGFASLCYFLIIDAFYGSGGGALGNLLQSGLRVLVGAGGATLVLVVLALALTLWIGDISLKRVIGLGIVSFAKLRALVAGATAGSRGTARSKPKAPGPASLREAFHLPETLPRPKKATGAPAAAESTAAVAAPATATTLATIAPVDARTFIETQPPVGAAPVEALEEEEDPDDEDPDDEYDEDDVDEDDEYDDEDEDDEEGDVAVGSAASTAVPPAPVVVGEYEPPSLLGDDTRRTYVLPDLSLFDAPQTQVVDESHRSLLLEDTLASFGVGAKVTHIERGPSITRYELKPERGIKISRISALADDIALALAATSVRIEAPIPGKSAVGIEVPNAHTSIVAIREILEALPQRGTVPPLHMALGKDITGRPVFGDLAKMPHLLVAGATGSGKSVCLNGIIASLLVSATPDQVQMLFIDPKRVELTVYNGIPHLIKEVITDARLAAGALFEMTKEMDARYERFAKAGVRKIEEYNAKFPEEKLPYVVIVIDELADLMLIAPAKVETTICRLAQLARATGIHLVVATQRPSVDVITGIIKANIPSRIAFAVSSQVDSRTILDMAGAERLLGRGDMLFLPIDAPKPKRSQGALITGLEVTRLVEFWAHQARPENLLDVDVVPIEDDDKAKKDVDPLCYDAAKFIIESNYASTAQLQSQFSIGHPRAVRVMKQLEEFGVVGPHEGTKPRRINIGLGELETIAGRLGRSEQTDLFAQGA